MHENKERVLKVLGSYSRLTILATLIGHRERELTLYMLTKYSKLNKDIVRRNVSVLVDAGLVNMKVYGTIRIFSINRNNPIVDGITKVLIKSKLV